MSIFDLLFSHPLCLFLACALSLFLSLSHFGSRTHTCTRKHTHTWTAVITTHHYFRACLSLRCPCIQSKQSRAFTQISSNFFLAKASRQLFSWEGTCIQSPSCVWLLATSWTAAYQVSPSLTISWSLPKFMSIALMMPSSHLILCCPLLLLPSTFSSIRNFANESNVCIKMQEGPWVPLNSHPLLLGYVPVGNTTFYCGCFFSHKIFHFLL